MSVWRRRRSPCPAALSPSNFIATNPQLYRETIATSGANLVRGMKMLA
ncbi:hypothetical protein ACC684_39010, partial [Rhizobium ruizarguesonis]